MHNNRWFEGSMPTPFPDALAEFRVSTSAQEAQTGRSSGATVSQVTRSGTNEFHGTAFWFGRNAAFNARQATARERDPLKRNQPGGTLGGPLLRNRLFFFGGYQSTIERAAPSSTLSIVPTAAMLAGDWTAFNRCYRPTWRDPDLAAGRINPARYSPVALDIAAQAAAGGERVRRAALGRAQRAARQADRHAVRLPARRRTCRSSAATLARSTGRR